MEVLIFTNKPRQVTSSYLEQISKADPQAKITITATPKQEQLQLTQILIPLDSFTNDMIVLMPSLKWIHVPYAGVNMIIDAVKNTNIILTNSSGVHPIPISEQIFAYLLMFARDMHTAGKLQTKKEWGKEQLSVFELAGKTIVIVGLGRIGERTAELAKAFGMKVLAVKTKKTKEKYVDEVYTLDELATVLKEADFVVNCLPGTPETDCLYTMKQFKQMKKTAYFINIGRGLSVKEADLITALEKGLIAGAGLDVFATEPLPKNSPLWEMDNVIITPHHAGKTPEYLNRVIGIFCENLRAYIAKKKMPNEVDKKKGY